MKISIMGTGAYSLAIALQLAKNKENKIFMWTESENIYQEFQNNKKLKSIFDISIPENIEVYNDYYQVISSTDVIFLITSAKYIEEVCLNLKPYYNHNIPICIASKGILNQTSEVLSNVVKRCLKTSNIAVISGPTFAIDLINNEPCALAIAGTNNKTINLIKKILSNKTLKLRKSSDLLGVQICGSIKNIIAIAAGILKGLGYSESTQAFLINESLHDIKNIIYYLGGKKKTILSFAGIGDLLLTCASTKSRNYTFGYVIGSTKDYKKIQEYLDKNTVEGYYTLDSVYHLLNDQGITIPLINLIYDIVKNNQDPSLLASFLIAKD